MGRVLPTLARRGAPLSVAEVQRRRLGELPLPRTFDAALQAHALAPLTAPTLDVLQVNVGKRCNQTCRHCHVDAGPDRREVMPPEVVEAVLAFVARERVRVVDITGGAPELHPRFRELVVRARTAGAHVMHRCNLTAVRLPNYADIPELLAEHDVEIVASLPFYQARETDTQRGDGVFEDSIESLRRLNTLGYGTGGSRRLVLVTNPVGTFLPGNQRELEALWKRELQRRHGVRFDALYTITNMPISRFLEFLDARGRTIEYMTRLANAFNPVAAEGVMCRSMLSVGWDGTLYDCDFNQMLELRVEASRPQTIFEATRASLEGRPIVVGPHCFGCTAGAGSSCGGAVA